MTQRFEPGTIYATPGALRTLALAGETAIMYLLRHMSGDWGDICEEDKAENEYAMANELRILSAYKIGSGDKIWMITEPTGAVPQSCCRGSIDERKGHVGVAFFRC